ncbi:cytidine deaminase [Salinivibrio proteolyticus]|uniref:Cytidine deaminase n=1 Tax=Salinivibrio proteolyticus TaxID=334715 RepID=A0ABY7LE67_9GAMM|nr:cytidine deaminase [Salinivibrio proteolyticus]WBA13770.1 cytidine deaminase [Salinivibrio proteolyticus]
MQEIEQSLYDAALALLQTRYPTGWGGAAAVRLASGDIVTSVAPDVKNDALSLCMEVGAYLEAHKRHEVVTHSLCLCREDEHSQVLILSPCGVCQERLVHWGGDVKAAISTPDNQLVFKTVRELMPHHWSLVNDEFL